MLRVETRPRIQFDGLFLVAHNWSESDVTHARSLAFFKACDAVATSASPHVLQDMNISVHVCSHAGRVHLELYNIVHN